ncbi:uncharacterized protein DI49_0812 [Saccharomyces eubayanus]|uniref:uncharacterized protein n=1 Tax=Saccharomyces eubayanus TaxID=1080349 RepID=UPI0006C26BC6|nr:hypothetical protein DI49_0812 [Saccharomyces eubayanus]KOH00717.1 hypothetical protein DI49_0812 [Saccharomyces eubayanus]
MDPIDASSQPSSIVNSKSAFTREVYKTKIITEVITKIEYRNMPVSSSESTSEKLTSTTSPMSLTPTNTMVSGPVTKIDPIASELEGMIETPTDLTSVGSKVASVKPNLIPTEIASSILASEGSVPPHQESISELPIPSSFSSSKIPPETSYASEPTSLTSVSSHFENSFISEPSSSVTEEAKSSSSFKIDSVTSTAQSANTDVMTENTQLSATNSVPSSSSESTKVEANISGLNSGITNLINAQNPSHLDGFSSAEAESTVESQTVPLLTMPTLSSISNVHDAPAATSSFVQKEIMIEIKASKNVSETSSMATTPRSIGTEQTIIQTSQTPSPETQTSSYEEVTSSTSLSDGVVSSFGVETASPSDSTASLHHTTTPASESADSASDSNVINSDAEAIEAVGEVDLHDEL